MIQRECQDNPSIEAVFLFGHIPVPYSGDICPDGHEPGHKGAWPADVYYGDVDGVWTDSEVSVTGASSTRNHNVPGDGKFDQSEIPSAVELAVGRVDVSGYRTLFSPSEQEYARRYLNKNHAFRHGRVETRRVGLIDDNFFSPCGMTVSAWRNFSFHSMACRRDCTFCVSGTRARPY
jgi:hypothetical protein